MMQEKTPKKAVEAAAGGGSGTPSSHGPPIAAFQSLPLTKITRRSKRNSDANSSNNGTNDYNSVSSAGGTSAKTPIDPIDALGLLRENHPEEAEQESQTDQSSDITINTMTTTSKFQKQQHHVTSQHEADNINGNDAANNKNGCNNTNLLENLHRNWSSDPNQAEWEQACWASFVTIFCPEKKQRPTSFFFQPPPPTFAVVDGLWSQVVLPSLLKKKDEGMKKLPQLISQDVWTTLRNRLSFLHATMSLDNSGQQNNHHDELDEEDDGYTTNAPTIRVTHNVYMEYGHELAKQRFPLGSQEQWKLDFGHYLQSALFAQESNFQPQLEHVQAYASRVLIPYWISLGKTEWAGNLLHQPSFLAKEWKIMENSNGNKKRKKNAVQITMHHVKLMELYITSLGNKSSSTQWQEALGLYQGWHTLLQQEMEFVSSDDEQHGHRMGSPFGDTNSSVASSHSRLSASVSSSSSKAAKRKRRSSSSSRNKRKSSTTTSSSPWQLLVLGRSLYVLSISLDSMLTEMPGDGNAAMNVLWKRQAEYFTESMKTLSRVIVMSNQQQQHVSKRVLTLSYLLSAETWFAMSQCCATLDESDMEDVVVVSELASSFGLDDEEREEKLEHSSKEMYCVNVAKALLEKMVQSTNNNVAKKKTTLRIVWGTMQADIQETIGRWLYDQKRFVEARLPLEEATKQKRVVLSWMRAAAEENNQGLAGAISVTSKSSASSSSSFSSSHLDSIRHWWGNTAGGSVNAETPTTPTKAPKANDNGKNDPYSTLYYYQTPPFKSDSGRSSSGVLEDDLEQLCRQLCLHMPNNIRSPRKVLEEAELSLSHSLEYCALALHACDMSIAALSWLHEALIIKMAHLGKLSLEVARLNAAMAVVHEDLLQWEAGLSRYRECLRIRMHTLSQQDPHEWFFSSTSSQQEEEEVFRGVLENLRSMGNAYRMLGDHDNAIGCYWKIATMSRKEWEIQNEEDTAIRTKFWGFNGHRRMGDQLRQTPLPTLVLEEERYNHRKSTKLSTGATVVVAAPTNCIPQLQAPPRSTSSTNSGDNKNKKNGEHDDNVSMDREKAVLFEAAQSYQTILSLFKDKATSAGRKAANLANSIGYDDLPVLLASSYHLGLIHIHFGDYRSAISSLEHSMQSLWILDPSSSESSGSDSSDGAYSSEEDNNGRSLSSSSVKRKKPPIKKRKRRALHGIFGKESTPIEDEGVYHALGICRAACGEHDQAVRFHITALRCARRIYGVHSIRASEILYDAAISYWCMREYEKAGEFWSACQQIRAAQLSRDIASSSHGGDYDDASADDYSDDYSALVSGDMEYARILYNAGAALCAMGRFTDPRTMSNLEEARDIFSDQFDDGQPRVEIANCIFYIALTFYYRSLAESAISGVDTALLRSASINLNRAYEIYRSLGYLSANNSEDGQAGNCNINLVLQAHIRFVEASIAEALGKNHLALDTYSVALSLYRILGKEGWNLHIASVLNTVGKLYIKMSQDTIALNNLDEAFVLRLERLGPDHEAVGETLYHTAEIYARMEKYATAMEMYTEALRIQQDSEGSDSPAVALTLLKIASLYFKQGQYSKAMEKLNGSLVIRQERVDRVGRASRMVSFWSGDLADDYLYIVDNTSSNASGASSNAKREGTTAAASVLTGTTTTTEGGEHLRKVLQDDMTQEEVALAVVLHCMGNVHVRLGELDQAKTCYEQSLQVRRRHSVSAMMSLDGDIKLHVSDTLHNVGCLYELTDDYENALKYFATSLKLKHRLTFPKKYQNDTSNGDDDKENQIVLYEGKDSVDGTYLNTVGAGNLSYALTLQRMGSVHHHMKHSDVAYACFEAALFIQKQNLGNHHYRVARTLADMATTLRTVENKQDEALRLYREACDIRQLRYGTYSADVGHILYRMGTLHDSSKDYSRAVICYHHAIRVFGRRYVNTVGRRFCETVLLKGRTGSRPSISNEQEEEDSISSKDMLGKEGLTMVRSIEETDRATGAEFAAIAAAIKSAASASSSGGTTPMMNMDVHAPDCWVSLELYLLSLMDLFGKLKEQTVRQALEHLEQVGAESVKTSPDAITFKMLYLIQE